MSTYQQVKQKRTGPHVVEVGMNIDEDGAVMDWRCTLDGKVMTRPGDSEEEATEMARWCWGFCAPLPPEHRVR